MELRQLGKSGVKVPPVIFGAWAIGGWMWGGSEEKDAIEAIRASVANGVNAIDTAAIYGQGASERVVAKAIKGIRDKVIIATKCGRRWDGAEGSSPWSTTDIDGKPITIRSNSKADSVAYECEQSLKRLETDVIDLYQVHWPDNDTPVEETMGALAKLQKQGKIRAIGVSNYDVEWMRKASAELERLGTNLASLQPPYSLIQRQIEREIVPFCRKKEIGLVVYSPMERGLLTGKVTADREFPAGDHRANHKFFTKENRARVLNSLERVRPIAERHGVSFAQLVINWTIRQPGVTAALVGARDAEQAEHNARAMRFRLSDEELLDVREAFDDTSRVMTAG
jgi:aryl-alcohol dehydrogenase-like predicted oxidoreductase